MDSFGNHTGFHTQHRGLGLPGVMQFYLVGAYWSGCWDKVNGIHSLKSMGLYGDPDSYLGT